MIDKRKKELVEETKYLLKAIQDLGCGKEDPWTDPVNLAKAVKIGLLDAPHLSGNSHAAGKVFTQIKNGACIAINPESGKPLSEKERVSQIIAKK